MKTEKILGILLALNTAISIGALIVAIAAFGVVSYRAPYKAPEVPRTAVIVGYVFRDVNWNAALDGYDFVGQECLVVLNHYRFVNKSGDYGYYEFVNFTIAKVDNNGQYRFEVPVPIDSNVDYYGFRVFIPDWYSSYSGIEVIGTSWITVTNQTQTVLGGPIFLVLQKPTEEARG